MILNSFKKCGWAWEGFRWTCGFLRIGSGKDFHGFVDFIRFSKFWLDFHGSVDFAGWILEDLDGFWLDLGRISMDP